MGKIIDLLRSLPRALKILTWLHKVTDGKKTVTGLISLALWVVIYAVPMLYPEWGTAQLGQWVADFLRGQGILLDYDLLVGGGTLTVIGLLDKIRKYFIRSENAGETISLRKEEIRDSDEV